MKPPSTIQEATALGRIALEKDRARAAPLLSQLRGGLRRWEELGKGERRVLTRGPLVDFLLEKSYSLRFEDPQKMVALARVACAVADSQETRKWYGPYVSADERARAWAELANAYRVVDDFDHAGPAYAQAQKLAAEGTLSNPLLARVAELTALYLADLRLFSDAITVLEKAHELFRSYDHRGAERSLINLAHILTQANEPEKAAKSYLRMLKRMHPGSPHRLATIHSLALNLVECDMSDLAHSLLRRNLWLYRRGGKLNKYRLYWLEGKIAVGLHEYGKAEGKLNTARLAFLRVGKVGDAALVSMDLAWVYAKEGRRDQVIWLVDDMLRTFRSLGIARESMASLLLLKKSCEQRRPIETLCGQIEALAKLLPELTPGRGHKGA